MDDLLLALDRREVSILMLWTYQLHLIQSASIILCDDFLPCQLELNFGFDGVVLSWFQSYLADRQQTVVVCGFRLAPSLV